MAAFQLLEVVERDGSRDGRQEHEAWVARQADVFSTGDRTGTTHTCLLDESDYLLSHVPSQFISFIFCLQEKPDEHGQGKWEGKQEGKSDKRITEPKARQRKALHCA
jgi:hypothetical protein